MGTKLAVKMENVTKRFGATVACDEVNLEVEKGTIHAIVGENGAGKSTLMNVLYGMYNPEGGKVTVFGEEINFRSPRDAIARGIGMVHQHFMLVPSLTVAENVTLGQEITEAGRINREKTIEMVEAVSRRFGLPLNPRDQIRDLPVGLQQRVEILKALYQGASVLILDEPTAVLTPQETFTLLAALRGLANEGMTIIFISHHLSEVLELADTITVMRRGKVVGVRKAQDTNEPELARLMVGKDVITHLTKKRLPKGEPVLEVEVLYVLDDRFLEAVRGVSLTVRAGEIVGVAGVAGNGQEELVEAILGQREIIAGTVRVNGMEVTGKGTKFIRGRGLAYVPSDRISQGLSTDSSVLENAFMGHHNQTDFRKSGFVVWDEFRARCKQWIDDFDVRIANITQPVASLSGGNMQKLILAREFNHEANVLLCNSPTRGIDIGSTEYVHRKIIEKRDEGNGVLLVSMQLDEILQLSDRILVMHGGRVVGEVTPDTTNEEELGLLMAGSIPSKA